MHGTTTIPQLVRDAEGPLWIRHFSQQINSAKCSLLTKVLQALNLKRMMVAHTVQLEGINAACEGKVWRVDTGLSKHYGGTLEVLEIRADRDFNILRKNRN